MRPASDEIGKTERTETDKKRERRKKKQLQKLNQKKNDQRIEEKEKSGIKATSKEKHTQLMNQVTKGRNVMKVYLQYSEWLKKLPDLEIIFIVWPKTVILLLQGKNTTYADSKALKSSKSFFTELQDNTSLKRKSSNKKKLIKDSQTNESSAKRFKL